MAKPAVELVGAGTRSIEPRRARILGLVLASGLIALCGSSLGIAQSDDADFIPLRTSINALMVALVDHAAHEIWEAGSAKTLTGRDWQTVEQHAIQLVASGTADIARGDRPSGQELGR